MNLRLLTNCCGKCQKGKIMEIMRTFSPHNFLLYFDKRIKKDMKIDDFTTNPNGKCFHRLNIIISNNNIFGGFKFWNYLEPKKGAIWCVNILHFYTFLLWPKKTAVYFKVWLLNDAIKNGVKVHISKRCC